MNYLESVYCYTQYERLREGKEITYNSQNGNVMVTFSLLILIYGTLWLVILIFPSILQSLSDRAKIIWQIAVAVSIASVYPIVAKTIGRQDNFERISEIYLKMSSEEQAKIGKKGLLFFSLSMLYFPFVAFIIWLLG